ncbi:MAG: aryl-sulfate sulfotransferase [Pseudomonadota bacterium]
MRSFLLVSSLAVTCAAFACSETSDSDGPNVADSTTDAGSGGASEPTAGRGGAAPADDGGAPAAGAGNAATGEEAAGNAGVGPILAIAGQGGEPSAVVAGEGGSQPVEAVGTGGVPSLDASAGAVGSHAPGGAAGAEQIDSSVLPVAGQGDLTSLAISPLTLTPSFSTTTHDYYVRCVAGPNAVTVATNDANGPSSTDLSLTPDQAIVVGGSYWVRCLPPDFPTITVTRAGQPTPGYYLLNSAKYAAVFDSNGVPVWYARGTMPINVESPAPNVISFMRNSNAGAAAFYEILSLGTNAASKVMAPDAPTDDHEMRPLPNGNSLVLTYPKQLDIDLTGLKAYTSTDKLLGCKIEELDPSGSIVWSWLATDHIDPVQESLTQIPAAADGTTYIDAFHCNSIDVDATGNLLVSMRHTSSVFYVDRTSGQVTWKLGGTAYSKDGAALIHTANDPEVTFSQQHDARFQPNGNVSLFDDHGLGTSGVARGVEYAIDLDAKTATPVFQFLGSGKALYEGGFRRYADGGSLISWGFVPNDGRVLTEIDSDGNDVFDIAFSGSNVSYRAEKVPLSQFDIGLLRHATAR